MKKSQIYRTALDAIEFLLTADIGLSEDELLCLDGLYFSVMEQMKDDVHNVVSLKTVKDVSERI